MSTTIQIAPSWAEGMFDDAYADVELAGIPMDVTRAEVTQITSLLALRPEDAILDLACGLGRHSLELARRGYRHVTGLDFTASYVTQAQRAATSERLDVRFVVGDMRALPFEGEFDAIFNCFNSMFYWDDATHQDILSGLHRALRPGGRVYIECYNRERFVGLQALEANSVLRRLSQARNAVRAVRRRLRPKPADVQRKQQHFDALTGELHGTRWLRGADGTVREDPFQIRLYAVTELRALLERAGFEVTRVTGTGGRPFTTFTPRVIVIARRA